MTASFEAERASPSLQDTLHKRQQPPSLFTQFAADNTQTKWTTPIGTQLSKNTHATIKTACPPESMALTHNGSSQLTRDKPCTSKRTSQDNMEIQTNIKHHNRHPRCAHDSREESGQSPIWTLRSSAADFHPLTRQDHA